MKFKKPRHVRIDRSDQSANLYALEDRATGAIKSAATEILRAGNIYVGDRDRYWGVAIPMELRSILESFEDGASTAAAIAYLESKGYDVKDTKPQGERGYEMVETAP